MTNYFELNEFTCRCANQDCEGKLPKLKMKPQLLQALNRVREEFGQAILVTSGYRCDAHNRAVGGAKASQHLTGSAADIIPSKNNPEDLERLWELCLAEKGFTGIGDGRDSCFIHVDCRVLKPSEKRKTWKYS